MSVRVCLWNMLDLYRDRDEARHRLVEERIRHLRPDILLALELGSPTAEDGDRAVPEAARRLGQATGLCCTLPGGTVTAAAGSQGILGMGVLWRPGTVTPVPESWWSVRDGWWHGICGLTVDIGAPVTVVAYHGPPNVGRPWPVVNAQRRDEADRLVDLLKQLPPGPVLVGGDWNSIADRHLGGAGYDPPPRFGDDQATDRVLADAGWLDTAVDLAAPWQPTAGYRPDRHGLRRLDRVLANTDAASLLAGYEVDASPEVDAASDHRPVVVHLRGA